MALIRIAEGHHVYGPRRSHRANPRAVRITIPCCTYPERCQFWIPVLTFTMISCHAAALSLGVVALRFPRGWCEVFGTAWL